MIDASGTSFHGLTIRATVRQMQAVLGLPDCAINDGTDKVNIEWVRKTDAGDVFTVYDWKEYRPLAEDTMVNWHIGAHSAAVAADAVALISKTSAESFG